MIDDARARQRQRGLRFDKRVLIFGFSASGMFTNRFVFLHPDRVKAAAFGSPGGWAIEPVSSWKGFALPYPVGVSDFKAVSGAYAAARKAKGKPTAIIARTVKGKGVSFMENNAEWHGKVPNKEQMALALKELV